MNKLLGKIICRLKNGHTPPRFRLHKPGETVHCTRCGTPLGTVATPGPESTT